jgi:hypothetical protein
MKTSESGTIKDLAVERAILGAALLEPADVVSQLRDQLAAEEFYLAQAHQLIYLAILDALDAGTPADAKALLFAVGNLLEERGQLDEVGGRTYLSDLVAQACLSASVPFYIEKIQESARKRELQTRLLEAFEKVKEDPQAALEELAAQVKLDRLVTATDEAQPAAGIAFPEGAYLGVAADFADTYSTACESPKSYFYLSFLTCLRGPGWAIASACREPQELPHGLYTVLLGPSGISRKSTAIKLTTDFLCPHRCGLPCHSRARIG